MNSMDMDNIRERLAEIERTQERVLVLLEALTAKVEANHAKGDVWRARVDLSLHGDGNGHRGLFVRLDRLEQSHDRSKWAVRTLGAAVIALLASAAFKMLGH